ncbi:unnamed protein product [Acanthoscelides obtectus]|uniref:Serendipity locus protein alpha n=1 Tax=Acanthoscelides obtectus TaxID=200917 RepID=A0A9P0MH76_ACAOB|nr:unnamed protein product [Acanthoscelides obtectus]CAK1632272.1 hypothetical protein AOBTE_LOCUS7452 [Acanthoscelides obtectus]
MNKEGLYRDLSTVKQQIGLAKQFLESLNSVKFDRKNVLSWFKKLCGYLTDIILTILEIRSILENHVLNKKTMLLYLHQINTTLSLYINTFVAECEIGEALNEVRIFTTKKLSSCLDGIEDVLIKGISTYPENVGNFILWMDTALEKMSEIDHLKEKEKCLKAFSDAKILFEEVLSHAMSIAQVSMSEDYKIIRGSSQSVLEGLESLSNEISKENPNSAMVKLFAETCSNKLCALERKVNVAVLKICLSTFAKYTDDLENIHKFCFNTENKSKPRDLDNLVMEFDLHVDRIMQIGLFAISCSTNMAIIREVKAASDVFLPQEQPELNFKVYKRCKILLNGIYSLCKNFLVENSENSFSKEESLGNEQPVVTGNGFLDHIINRGKQILQDRSILYRSNKIEAFDLRSTTLSKMNALKEKNKSIPLSKLVHLRKISFVQSPTRNQISCELQITDIVNELRNMSLTFEKC